MVNGVLIIDKPANSTSHDVVQAVRKLTGERQVGHAGTLDPFATGVLVVGIGYATRLLEYVHMLPKTYEATFVLGATSDTDDIEGQIKTVDSKTKPSLSDIENSLTAFVGTIQQLPPTYAAIKIKGKKMYELARAGEAVTSTPRTVTVHSVSLQEYTYPNVTVTITCGTGTYIRAIGRDLGEALGVGAYTSQLRRTAIGTLTTKEAVLLTDLSPENVSDHLLPPNTLTSHLPVITLSPQDIEAFRHGKTIAVETETPAGICQIQEESGYLAGIGEYTQGILVPKKVLPS